MESMVMEYQIRNGVTGDWQNQSIIEASISWLEALVYGTKETSSFWTLYEGKSVACIRHIFFTEGHLLSFNLLLKTQSIFFSWVFPSSFIHFWLESTDMIDDITWVDYRRACVNNFSLNTNT